MTRMLSVPVPPSRGLRRKWLHGKFRIIPTPISILDAAEKEEEEEVEEYNAPEQTMRLPQMFPVSYFTGRVPSLPAAPPLSLSKISPISLIIYSISTIVIIVIIARARPRRIASTIIRRITPAPSFREFTGINPASARSKWSLMASESLIEIRVHMLSDRGRQEAAGDRTNKSRAQEVAFIFSLSNSAYLLCTQLVLRLFPLYPALRSLRISQGLSGVYAPACKYLRVKLIPYYTTRTSRHLRHALGLVLSPGGRSVQ
ncbi:hypothetical protein KQX54_020816 [Cotesia glomerata]|uniref:Uncharacterized protein n=1 Tax=Cotesia glomerata TaxID=32391 RepID=A0AAV7I525_COTGL|nr:hypothetical protein KQX54_020816 [Cotesia glomerata]